MSEFQENEIHDAAKKAWQDWHDHLGAVVDEDDDYVPTMSIQWEVAFMAGLTWMQNRGKK